MTGITATECRLREVERDIDPPITIDLMTYGQIKAQFYEMMGRIADDRLWWSAPTTEEMN